jgi:hypothetical protein
MAELLPYVLGQTDIWWYGFSRRMEGLTDEELLWQPVPSAWCLETRDGGLFYTWPPGSRGETEPPVTTMAWRMCHVAYGCFRARTSMHFGDGSFDFYGTPYPSTAAEALAELAAARDEWHEAIRSRGESRLWQPLGDAEGNLDFMQLGHDDPFLGLVLHINRELMHHGAEMMMMRDLHRATAL